MSEIYIKVTGSGKDWAGIKKGDLLKVVKVETGDHGLFATLEDSFELPTIYHSPEVPHERSQAS